MCRRLRLFCRSMLLLCCATILISAESALADAVIIDHRHTDITQIPQNAIEQAKTSLHIAYGHTSHGSQLTTGMTGLVGFADAGGLGLSLPTGIFAWNNGGRDGALDLHDRGMGGDVGYYPQWENNTRAYLDNPDHADVNVIIWSWCGQASGYTEQQMIDRYLAPMTQLEQDYPDVTFVYMTGHLDGGGESGNLNQRNEQIRNYCTANEKVLYDFADIESYDPDGFVNYMLLDANDACAYDSDGNGSRDENWAINWQESHTQGLDWYSCGSAHSQALNANRKAYAAWWLWATLGGWNPSGQNRAPTLHTIGDQQVLSEQRLSLTVSATDLDPNDILTYSASPLPDGARFDTDSGAFSWTPTTDDEGDHQITFAVADNGSPQGTDQETVTIAVLAPTGENHAPTLDTIGDREVDSEQLLSFTLSATDLDPNDTLTYSVSPLPDGAVFDDASGTFSWTPTTDDVGDHQLTFAVADNGTPQGTDQETVTISVLSRVTSVGREVREDGGSGGCFIFSIL